MTNEKNIPNDSSSIQQIKKTLRECVSFNGVLTRLHFWECMIIGYVFYSFFSLTEIPYFDIIGWFCYFYIALSCYQKRCRDLNIRGTLIILGVSIFFIMVEMMRSLNIERTDVLFTISKFIFLIYLGIYLYAQFMPSSKEKGLTLTSPLLKHPNVYFVICVALFFIGRYVLQNWYL